MFKTRPAALLCALVMAVLPADAQIYPLAEVDRAALAPAPAPLAGFLTSLRRLDADGAFEAGRGMTARDDLDGLGAKAWLLAHVAPDFRCLSDFGGTCPAVEGPHAHVARFLARFGDRPLEFAAIAQQGIRDLAPIRLEMRAILQPHRLYSREEGMLCSPQAQSPGSAAVEAALTEWSGDDLLPVLDRLHAVMGRYNIRAAPSITAPVLTQTRDAILYFPDPWTITEEPREDGAPYRWREVMLPDGQRGHVAPEPGDLLDAGGLSEQVCFDIVEGQPRIRLHVGGGD